MGKKRKQYSASFKSKVALAALKVDETTSEIAARFQIQPTMVNTWKRELLENAPELFEGKKNTAKQTDEPSADELLGRFCMKNHVFLTAKYCLLKQAEGGACVYRIMP